ncbi:MAG TPA: hypothetical protein H9786_00525 [Candidatus Brachybacterium merdavium]|uniref:Uncharacterized protein n=1 Tax=Candidatus Brachybacterium merdavium TaxID=2838513 RepID=A0A9D2RMP5_9MICO|nr:hypothetical protein [Candidatus Brachybacterium merdavium]
MTSAGPVEGEHTAWDGESSAVQDLRDLLVPLAPEGALRIVLQRLALHESSRPVGEHEVLDVVADVEGNLVSVPLRGRVREDPPLARALDETVTRLRHDVLDSGAEGLDSLEVILDADGSQQVRIAFGLDVTPAEAEGSPLHPAVHGGAHHITQHAPVLDELRDRLAGPQPGPLRRIWCTLTGRARAGS